MQIASYRRNAAAVASGPVVRWCVSHGKSHRDTHREFAERVTPLLAIVPFDEQYVVFNDLQVRGACVHDVPGNPCRLHSLFRFIIPRVWLSALGRIRWCCSGFVKLFQVVYRFPVAEVAERFVGLPLPFVIGQQGQQLIDNVFQRYHVFVDKVQPVAPQVATDQDGVFANRFADQTDIGGVRSSAGVGAAGHADRKLVGVQTHPGQLGFKPVDHTRQNAFRLGDRQAAGGKRRARHRVTSDVLKSR